MTFTIYDDMIVRRAVLDMAYGDWQRGLAEGRYAWDLSNITADPIVNDAWKRIMDRGRGRSYTESAMQPHIDARRAWTGKFKERLDVAGFEVLVQGSAARICAYGARFEASGENVLLKLAEQHGLEVIAMQFHDLALRETVDGIPIFQALGVRMYHGTPAFGRDPATWFIVGRLDIPVYPRPWQRVLDTLRKARTLARKVAASREDWDAKVLRARAAEEAVVDFPTDLPTADEAAISAAF